MTLRYRLRTLLIVLALGPPVIAGAWFAGLAAWKPRRDPGRINCSTTMGGPDRIDERMWATIMSHP